jgi:DNA-binding PadR family transcriptional regulator
MSARPLNATAASLLGLLHDGPLTGWELVALAQERIGNFWTLTQSQVYRELAAMAADGLVEVGPPGPRDRKPHSLTDAGREAFARWLDAEPAADQVRIPLLLKIAFAPHLSPGRLAEMIADQRAEHRDRLAGYRAASDLIARAEAAGSDARIDPARRATLEYGLRHEQAVLDWLDALPKIIGPEGDASP